MQANDLHAIFQTQQQILEAIENLQNGVEKDASFGGRCADWISKWFGSWTFIIGQASILALYVCVNIIAALAFDPFPFRFLNLILSFQAAFSVPVILMSQNRQEAKDRRKALAAYRTIENVESLMLALDSKVTAAKRKQENGE